jgi:NitT/TauT family transport system substrate-binding protein
MTKGTRLGAGSLIASLLLVTAAACGSSTSGNPSASGDSVKATTVRLVMETPSSGNVTEYLADKEGFFAKNHINIILVQLPAGPQATAALVGGSIDVGQLGIENTAPLLAKGQKMVLIAENNTNYWTIMTSPSLAAQSLKRVLQGLSGKTVSAPSVGGEGGGFVRYLASLYGLSPTAINLTADPSNSAVLSGQSAGAMTDTIGACVLGTHGYKEAFSFSDPKKSSYPQALNNLMQIPDIGYWVTGSYAAAHAQVLSEFQTAINETIAWSKANLGAAAALLEKNRTALGYPSMPTAAYQSCMKQIINEGVTSITRAQVATWSKIVQIEKLSGPLPPTSQWTIKGVVAG